LILRLIEVLVVEVVVVRFAYPSLVVVVVAAAEEELEQVVRLLEMNLS